MAVLHGPQDLSSPTRDGTQAMAGKALALSTGPPGTAPPLWFFISHACVHARLLQSCPTLRNLRTTACQAPLFMGFSRQEYWSGLPCPPLISHNYSRIITVSWMLRSFIWWFSEQALKHLAKVLWVPPSCEATTTSCFGKFFPPQPWKTFMIRFSDAVKTN